MVLTAEAQREAIGEVWAIPAAVRLQKNEAQRLYKLN